MGSESFKEIFAENDVEPLTDELITELSEKGIPKKDLLQLKKMGHSYNRSRNSFPGPLQFEIEGCEGFEGCDEIKKIFQKPMK